MTSAHTTETPGSGNLDNGAAITVGNKVMFADPGTVSAIRFWVPTTNTGTYTVGLYEVTSDDDPLGTNTGTLLQSASVGSGSVTPDGWAEVPITPVDVDPGVIYLAARHSSSGRFAQTTGALASPISNGGITIIASGTDPNPPGLGSQRNGCFNEGAALAYPADAFGTPDYFTDVAFGSVAEVTGTGSAALGGLTAAATGTVEHPGTAAAQLGGLTATASGTVEHSGTAAAQLGGLTAQATGVREVAGTAAAGLGGLVAVAAGGPERFGTAASTLGGLVATAVGEASAPASGGGGGWYGLLDILREGADLRRQEASARPVACPNDGEPLLTGPDGGLFCPFDGWRPNL